MSEHLFTSIRGLRYFEQVQKFIFVFCVRPPALYICLRRKRNTFQSRDQCPGICWSFRLAEERGYHYMCNEALSRLSSCLHFCPYDFRTYNCVSVATRWL
jgi:hypothetical protein